MKRTLAASLLLGLLAPVSAGAAPSVDVHTLKFLVHQQLVTQSEPLSFWEDLIRQAVVDANAILQGDHGPFDVPCCVRLDDVSIQTFDGTDASPPRAAEDLLVPDSEDDFDALSTIGGSGSRAFVVDRLLYCGGPTGSAIGCADQPFCPPPSDADLILVVTRQAHVEFDSFADTLAHERGHNSCLEHVGSNLCQLMRPSAGGSCLDPGECGNYQSAGVAGGDVCPCHTDLETRVADGQACVDLEVSGICSGGLCGEVGSDASLQLLAAGGPGNPFDEVTDDRLRLSGLTGGWSDEGPFAMGAAPQGLEYAPGRNVVYGVSPTAGDDRLFRIDPGTGEETTIGSVTGFAGLKALAFDPGPTGGPDDDRLLALDDEGDFDDLVEIDPDTAAGTQLGGLDFGFPGDGFTGLAYDSQSQVLYTVADLGSGNQGMLFTIDIASCSVSFFCSVAEAPQQPDLPPRGDPALAYSADTGKLYLVGFQSQTPTLFDTIDPNQGFATPVTLGVDPFTAGGLAAVPAPEPSVGWLQGAALLAIGGLARRSRRR